MLRIHPAVTNNSCWLALIEVEEMTGRLAGASKQATNLRAGYQFCEVQILSGILCAFHSLHSARNNSDCLIRKKSVTFKTELPPAAKI